MTYEELMAEAERLCQLSERLLASGEYEAGMVLATATLALERAADMYSFTQESVSL